MPTDHPLRVIKMLADQALKALSPDPDRMYANVGRPSIPPERLLKSSLLIALYSVRSERAFCEQLDYNLLFRWFLDMNPIEPSFDATTFTKNRERLLRHGVGQALFGEVVLEAERQGLLSDERFTVDGTLIEAAASLKSFKPKDGDPPRATDADPGNPSVDFHGERRSNATHQSATDPEARLLRKGKGKEARLVFMAHALMENRHGMLVDFQTTRATGTAERDIVPELLDQSRSMGLFNNFQAAKKVTLALIRRQYPRDRLHIIGFSDYAREIKEEELADVSWNAWVSGTNLHHALMLARKLLSREKGATKQVLLITDGEPTAHLEGERAYFAYPPS